MTIRSRPRWIANAVIVSAPRQPRPASRRPPISPPERRPSARSRPRRIPYEAARASHRATRQDAAGVLPIRLWSSFILAVGYDAIRDGHGARRHAAARHPGRRADVEAAAAVGA